MKLTPDELAEAVKKIVTDNGDILTGLLFDTLYGSHSYRTVTSRGLDGTPVAVFMA